MKKIEQSRVRFSVIVCGMIGLIIVGAILSWNMLDDYSALMLNNTDNQLISLARSVDRSADSHLVRYIENLSHTMMHEERKVAEEQWLTEGDGESLLAFLDSSLIGRDKTIVDVLILEEDRVYISLTGELDYQLMSYGVTEDGKATGVCKDSDGDITVVIAEEVESGISYAILVDMNVFYEEITAKLSDDLHNEIFMMDSDSQMLIHRQGDGVEVDNIDEFSEADSKYNMLSFLVVQQECGEEGTDFCDAVSSATGRAYTARMAVVPATEDTNGLFAVGVSTDYDQITKPMRLGIARLVVYGGASLIGVMCLVLLLLHTFRGNQRALQEVRILQEKNAAMEELNRQTQEFAHHQRLELMGTLTSGIAHEFNNLLAPIMGYSILVLEKLPPEETELYDEVLEIYNTSMKAKTVVSRLQDLARKNSGTDFHKLPVDEVVRKVVEIANPAKPKTVELQMELAASDKYITGNETQISQLLLNLLINAFHATEKNGGMVTVTTKEEEGRVILGVADNGYGISEDNKKRIFEPFFTTKKGGEGTGLGLAIAEQVVEEHGGSIRLESEEGIGTAFYVEFPTFSEKS